MIIREKYRLRHELALEQSQQGASDDVLVNIEGVKEWKRNVRIKGLNKEAIYTLSTTVGDLRDPIWIKLVSTGYRFGPVYELTTQSIGIRAIRYREVVLFQPTGYSILEDPEEEPIEEEPLEEPKEKVIMEYLVKISKTARILELKRRNMKKLILTSYTPYPSRKIRHICACTSLKTTKETRSIRRAASVLHPYHFTYPERRLTMEEMLYKFIDEGKREHEEMRAFICKFRTTNDILFKERNNSLRVTTRGGKTTTHDVQTNSTNVHTEEPVVVNYDKPVKSNEVLDKDQPKTTNKPVIQTSSKEQTPSIPIPRRLRIKKEES
ncbi:hypothetical protein Tco_0955398 [Tanacetum coccineum]|uniref:Uncharacterized protein n=1 Tax=Tanacetum coccineum TaxID=301880 RepID=A0ABQ5E736_9ASTR